MMMKPCSCQWHERDPRGKLETIRTVSTHLVLIEQRAETPFRKGSRAATQIVLIDRNQKRRDQ